MKVLLDHNLPRHLKPLLRHEVFTAREMRWDALITGALLATAERGGFQVLVTGDQSLSYQQNNLKRKISLVVLTEIDRRLVVGREALIQAAIERITAVAELVQIPGRLRKNQR